MGDLRRRTLTALVYGAVVLVAIVAPPFVLWVVLAALAVLGAAELAALRAGAVRPLLGILFMAGLVSLGVLRSWGPLGAHHGVAGELPVWIFAVLLPTWAADVAAYLVGSAFGRRKLAPAISPGKTWEGTLAGFAACAVVAFGVGALFVRRKPRVRLEAQMHGGGHERGLRSGTLPTHQIVGMGEAFRIAKEEMATENERIRMLRDRLWAGISTMEQVFLNGDWERRVPHNLNVSFNFVEGESLIMAIKDIAVSSGSACTSASLEPSYVLRALGRSDELAHSSIRFTVGRFTTEEEIDYTVQLIARQVARLREMSPLWEMYKDGIDLNTVQWAAH